MGDKTPGDRQWVTVPEAAQRLGVTERAVIDLIQAKKVIAERAAKTPDSRGVWLIYWPSLQDYNPR